MSQTIYLVYRVGYEEYTAVGAFTTREKAESKKDECVIYEANNPYPDDMYDEDTLTYAWDRDVDEYESRVAHYTEQHPLTCDPAQLGYEVGVMDLI